MKLQTCHRHLNSLQLLSIWLKPMLRHDNLHILPITNADFYQSHAMKWGTTPTHTPRILGRPDSDGRTTANRWRLARLSLRISLPLLPPPPTSPEQWTRDRPEGGTDVEVLQHTLIVVDERCFRAGVDVEVVGGTGMLHVVYYGGQQHCQHLQVGQKPLPERKQHMALSLRHSIASTSRSVRNRCPRENNTWRQRYVTLARLDWLGAALLRG